MSKLNLSIAACMVSVILAGFLGYYLGDDAVRKVFLSEIFLSFCAGILVSLFFSVLIQNILVKNSEMELIKQRRLVTTSDLYERFHSPEFVKIRCEVGKFYSEDVDENQSLNDLHSTLYMSDNSKDRNNLWVSISSLMHFF